MALTWLHVSDFHLSDKALYDADKVLKGLVKSVQWHRENTDWKPDILFATGDIAGNGAVTVFKKGKDALATKFFDALLEAAGYKDRERLFIVPGNHDVERKKGIGLIRAIEEGVDDTATQKNIDKYFQESSMYHLTYKLEAFAEWYNDYFSAIPIPRRFPVK
jgi:3',5'-cyclic AMP phosphodiesterase CpdA